MERIDLMPDINKYEFGKKIKELRLKRHYSLRQVSRQSQTATKKAISPSYWSLIERGKRNIPRPCTLKRMAKGLKTSPNEIMQLAGYTEITSSNRKINSYTENKIDLGNLIDNLLVATTKETQAELWGQPFTWEEKNHLRVALLAALSVSNIQVKKQAWSNKFETNLHSTLKG